MLAMEFRKYQKDALDAFDRLYAGGRRRFHFVAPPGSGKTLMGLEMMCRTGLDAVVFSPTVAIQAQWVDYAKTWGVGLSASCEPGSGARLLSLTYQSVCVRSRDGDGEHPNSKALLAAIASRSVVILDECHHLTKEWARVIGRHAAKHGSMLIGLTATPPVDAEPGEREVYDALLGEVSAEIPLPPVVKEGYLAPFQDLVYLVSPTDRELEALGRRLEPYRRAMRELLTATDVTPLHFWAEERLAAYRDERGTPWTFAELYRKRPGLCVAMARFVAANGLALPPSVMPTQEMDEPPRFPDALLTLEDYLYGYLVPLAEGAPTLSGSLEAPREGARKAARDAARALLGSCREALAALGYAVGPVALARSGDTVDRMLGRSEAKALAVKPIIAREMAVMGDDFRGLILCDHERDGDYGLGALSLMEFMTTDPATDECDPILLTGTTVLVDDDILDDFLAAAGRFLDERGIDIALRVTRRDGFCEIGSESSLWSTRAYVPLISEIFERGISRCLVSTRAMLGEGWNSLRLNTLIDLTGASSFAFANQMRGRTLRLDPDRPLKAANNWDVVAVFPDDEQGYGDLERLERKYSRFYGLGAEGTIERGIAHLHPGLDGRGPGYLHGRRDAINAAMLERASDRLSTREAWGVGKPYRNEVAHVLDIRPADGAESRFGAVAGDVVGGFETALRRGLTVRRWSRAALGAATVGGAAWALTVSAGAAAWIAAVGLFAANGIRPFPNGAIMRARARSAVRGSSLRSLVARLCDAVVETARAVDPPVAGPGVPAPTVEDRGEAGVRVSCDDAALGALATTALADILSPPANKKYLVSTLPPLGAHEAAEAARAMTDDYRAFAARRKKRFGPLGDRERRTLSRRLFHSVGVFTPADGRLVFPVPEAFSGLRAHAELFRAAMDGVLGDARLIGPRETALRDALGRKALDRSLPLRFRLREIWL
ncbi:MAG: hypothetical protein CVV47_08390 [Spirochaetae bacterium HGW-Spirochaetae-3]|jgi:hypothetical protein|nr:MAG: hypothetical protein CVV47_08390 [Spirochaetae bacterium HGW-Spirochaetae-3]